MAVDTATPPIEERLRRAEARLARERAARLEAERLLESKSLQLYEANCALTALAADLEQRVEARTQELSLERQRAVQMAEIDTLTGIANRASFARHLEAFFESDGSAPRPPDPAARQVAVVMIDLDDFKTVNDTLGHAAGDALLVETARRIAATVRPGDVVARLGGDEFAVLAGGVGGSQGALAMAHRLLRALCRPLLIGGRPVPCSCSIGIAETLAPGHGAEALLGDADLALYASKRAGRGRVTAFETSLRADLERRAKVEAEVREAVAADRIQPWYQPIVRRSTGRWVGVEMLARWHTSQGVDGAGGEVRSPATFIETVESLGLLDTMTEKLLLVALREAAPLLGLRGFDYVSVNVSPTQFNQGWVLERLPAVLVETGFPARHLVVEITETALHQDIERTRSILHALTAQGIRIALDDFGVGYSNFSLLRQLPIHLLKLDRTLISDIETDEQARALAECILDLAKRLKIRVVAEGVETERQAALLAAARCAAMQGYWFARPRRRLDEWFGDAALPPPRAWRTGDDDAATVPAALGPR